MAGHGDGDTHEVRAGYKIGDELEYGARDTHVAGVAYLSWPEEWFGLGWA